MFAEISPAAFDEIEMNADHLVRAGEQTLLRFEPGRHCLRQAADEVVIQRQSPRTALPGGTVALRLIGEEQCSLGATLDELHKTPRRRSAIHWMQAYRMAATYRFAGIANRKARQIKEQHGIGSEGEVIRRAIALHSVADGLTGNEVFLTVKTCHGEEEILVWGEQERRGLEEWFP